MKFTLPTLVAMIAASPMLAAQPVERDDTYVELAAPVVVTLVTHWDKGKVAGVDLSGSNDDKVQVDDDEWRRVVDYTFEDATQQKFFGVEREGPEGPHITVSLCQSCPNWGLLYQCYIILKGDPGVPLVHVKVWGYDKEVLYEVNDNEANKFSDTVKVKCN
jgi:hypothetical protein